MLVIENSAYIQQDAQPRIIQISLSRSNASKHLQTQNSVPM
jgi:hypothetical protein